MKLSSLFSPEPSERLRFFLLVFFFLLFSLSKTFYCCGIDEEDRNLEKGKVLSDEGARIARAGGEDLYFSTRTQLKDNKNISSMIHPSSKISRERNHHSVGLCLTHSMLEHALVGYFGDAFPFDSHLAPGRFGENKQGSLYTTLIDILDTLAITNHTATFLTSVRWIAQNVVNFDVNKTVSVFRTITRIVGGLLSGHLMIEEGIMPDRFTFKLDGKNPEEFVYRGELLVLATDLADRLLPAFNTPSGLPRSVVHLRSGLLSFTSTEVGNSEAGAISIEMALLSHFTGNPKYREVAEKTLEKLATLRDPRSKLTPSFFDSENGKPVHEYATIGGGQDSTIEYFFKYHILSGKVKWWRHFEAARLGSLGHLRRGGIYFRREIFSSKAFIDNKYDALNSFYPGLLLLAGRKEEGTEPLWVSHGLLRRYGVLPDVVSPDVRESPSNLRALLRPEHVESVFYYYHATHDPAYEAMGEEFAKGIHLRGRVPGGLASLKKSSLPTQRFSPFGSPTESFFVGKTLKFLYLLLEEAGSTKRGIEKSERGENEGRGFRRIRDEKKLVPEPLRPWMRNWIFTTEAHMIPDSFFFWAPEVFQRKGMKKVEGGENRNGEDNEKNRAQGTSLKPENRDSSLGYSSSPPLTLLRLESVHSLISLSAFRSVFDDVDNHQTGFRKLDWMWDDRLVGDAGYFCMNYPLSSLRRLSDSFIR